MEQVQMLGTGANQVGIRAAIGIV
ncbi:MAG: hypothetical protein RL595_2512, partial [Planctomycetota bacterium]